MTDIMNGRIGVLGGTFDPVHLGHKALGEAAIKEAALDELIVMPAKIQPFKLDRKIAADYHRLAMAKLAFAHVSKAQISDYEIENTTISYSYDTLNHIKVIYRDSEIFFIVGTDSFMQMEKWYKGKEILSSFSLIVSVRPGYAKKELHETCSRYCDAYGTHIIRIAQEMPDVSSTIIREAVSAGNSLADLVPESVERYIRENGLYLRD